MYHGYPEEIVSDRDPRFVSKFLLALHKLTGCRPALSTSYHPQTDGQTERTNRILEDYLKHYVREHEEDWESHLPEAELTYNKRLPTIMGFRHPLIPPLFG
jgi:transposase InsO family protein